MQQVPLLTTDGTYEPYDVYTIDDFPYDKLRQIALKCKHKKHSYLRDFGTFDIETTTIDEGDRPYGYMYHWQMCVAGYVCIGRTWESWVAFLGQLSSQCNVSAERRFVIYIHNEGFEFQFIKDFLMEYCGGYQVFAAQPRKPIHVTTPDGFEFRCSWKLSNMSLEKATTTQKGVRHPKAAGDLDYRVIRTADTILTEKELGYCVSDVVSLYEYVQSKMDDEMDNLETIPMTSTGYVRRACRKSCRSDRNYRQEFLKREMTPRVYKMLKEAARGGDTHANRHMSGRIWDGCDSYDVASSYPYQMICQKFPMTKFVYYGEIDDIKVFDELLAEYACLFRINFERLELKPHIAMPYISHDKCLTIDKDCDLDNGRVLWGNNVTLCLTDIDYKIIKKQYDIIGDFAISDMHIATYGYLPEALLNPVRQYFVDKTTLKVLAKREADKAKKADLDYRLGKAKNLLNAIFGMCYTDPVRETIEILNNEEWKVTKLSTDEEIQAALDKYMKSRNSFLTYAWGVWVTAWARKHLSDLVDATGQHTTIYCDTDSSKCLSGAENAVEALNREIIQVAEARHAYCDFEGDRVYMGIYEKENKKPIKRFKTLGAKKYCYEDDDGLHVTISGVSKKIIDEKTGLTISAKELGSIDNFRPGFVFEEAGGVTLYYNQDCIHKVTVDGCTMTTASNIGVVDSTYTLGLTGEYAELLDYNLYEDIDKAFSW